MLANKLQQRSTVRAGARRAALKVCLSTQGMQLMPRLGGMGVLGRGWAAGSGLIVHLVSVNLQGAHTAPG